jgi:hypothetical protein
MGHAGGWTLPFTRPARQRAASPKNDPAIHDFASISLSLMSGYSRVNWHFFPAHSAFDAGKAVFMFF